ncbi:hypothetical protein Csa_010752 [Cucumis sativus]|uniref:Protease inhibitor protein n=1 Tax=Cucumis sativus TaxID=3659 RepID=A0A0A0L4I0_CUCSA|nr:hypothetical protein Csa_010752 [Cucumis sativus]
MAEESAREKTQWPELVGVDYSTAATTIETENSHVKAIKFLVGSPMYLNFDPRRVRVVCDTQDKVVEMPYVG